MTVNSRQEEGGQRATRHDGVGNGKWGDPWEQLQAKLSKYVIYCKAGVTGAAGTAMAAPLFPKSELFLYSVV